jgi:hypothetical protein
MPSAALIQWLEKELATAEEFGDTGDRFFHGYQAAITNALDYLQGAEVYIESEG